MNSTIFALATPPGRGAIAIIRVSGPKALEAYHELTKLKSTPAPNQLKPAWIYDDKDKLDQSMLAFFKAPNSFTGEDMLEIQCHGSKIVQDVIMRILNSVGIEPAKPGEFSERAYYNGKIDVAQAEAIMELVASENTQLAKLATRQLAGEFSTKIADIRSGLTSLSSAIAADLDLTRAAESDDLTDSVDYGAMAKIVAAEVTGTPCNLIEKLAGRIGESLIATFDKLDSVAVTVHKPSAPLGVEAEDVSVTITTWR